MEELDFGEIRFEEISQSQLWDMTREMAHVTERTPSGHTIYWFKDARVSEYFHPKAGVAKYLIQRF